MGEPTTRREVSQRNESSLVESLGALRAWVCRLLSGSVEWSGVEWGHGGHSVPYMLAVPLLILCGGEKSEAEGGGERSVEKGLGFRLSAGSCIWSSPR
jgi:hypothetical protein